MIVVLHENERRGTEVCRTLTEKGFGNIYLLSGGIQQFYLDYPGLV
jgi:rhodanese-related sulfurtransferase